jgi:hypothetical protein
MMEIRQTAGTRRGHQADGLTLGAVLAGCLLMPGPGQADDLTECMINRMQQVDDTMTVGELRLKCQKQLHSGEYVTQAKPDAVVSQRLREDREHVLEPFTLTAHKPNYILVAAPVSSQAVILVRRGQRSRLNQQAQQNPQLTRVLATFLETFHIAFELAGTDRSQHQIPKSLKSSSALSNRFPLPESKSSSAWAVSELGK